MAIDNYSKRYYVPWLVKNQDLNKNPITIYA